MTLAWRGHPGSIGLSRRQSPNGKMKGPHGLESSPKRKREKKTSNQSRHSLGCIPRKNNRRRKAGWERDFTSSCGVRSIFRDPYSIAFTPGFQPAASYLRRLGTMHKSAMRRMNGGSKRERAAEVDCIAYPTLKHNDGTTTCLDPTP